MTDPQHELDTFARVRADVSGQDSVFWWNGNIYGRLSERIRTRVGAENPEYQRSSDQFTQPNETTWTSFKKNAHVN